MTLLQRFIEAIMWTELVAIFLLSLCVVMASGWWVYMKLTA